MFTEPQTVTVNATPSSMARTSFSPEGVFSNATDGNKLRISHSVGKRVRHTVRLDNNKIATDPLLDGRSVPASLSVYLVIDHPNSGYTSAEVAYFAAGLTDWLDTAGNLSKVINGES